MERCDLGSLEKVRGFSWRSEGAGVYIGKPSCSAGSGKARYRRERRIGDFESEVFLLLFAGRALSIVTFAYIYSVDR